MTLLVSVIIPCYNASAYLEEAIQSVLDQTYPAIECLIVDDGSQDDSLDKIRQMAVSHPQLIVLSKANGGRAAALNHGLQKIDPVSEFVVFFDADDVLHPEFVARNVAALLADPSVVTSATQASDFKNSIEQVTPTNRSRFTIGPWGARSLPNEDGDTPFFCFYCCTGQGPWAIHRRSAIEAAGGLEESLNQGAIHGNEDTDLFCKMALQGRVVYLNERLYYKRGHTTNVTKTHDMGYDRFREIWDARVLQLSVKKPELRLLHDYYHRVHRPLRDLKVATLAAKEFLQQPTAKRLNWLCELLATGLPGLAWGYVWFLLVFKARRKTLAGWI